MRSLNTGFPEPSIAAIVRGGVCTAELSVPVPWWSFTKTVLAAAALMLVSRRLLDLDEPLADEPYTLHALLQHRSGLPDYGSLATYHAAVAAGEPPWPIAEMLARAGAGTLAVPPGRSFLYSNIGYLMVRQAIERRYGKDLATSLRELVLAPLGIADATLACLPEDLDGTAWGNAAAYHPGWVYHGLLVGPASAAALLLHRLLAGELLPPDLLTAMCTPEPVFASVLGRPWLSVGYGLGIATCQAEAGTFVGHTGAGPGSVSAVYQNRASGVTVTVFSQSDSTRAAEQEAIRKSSVD